MQHQRRITKADVAPELQKYIISVPIWLFTNSLARKCLGKLRKLIIGKHGNDNVLIEEITIESDVELRIYKPKGKRSGASLLWIHGGGMITGDPQDTDILMIDTAEQLGIVIVAPRYRHAPKHPFPAHLDDCFAAWQWLLASAKTLEIDTQRLAIGGQSAGGGLSASLVHKIHDLGGVQPIAQWLYCPMLDDKTATNRDLDAIKHYIWNNQLNHFGWSSYLSSAFGTDTIPEYAVPIRRKNLSGLPPTWIGIGDIDLFYEEDKRYAERLRMAGVDVTLLEVPKAYHGFEVLANKTYIAQDFLQKSRAWLKEKLKIV